MFKMRISIWLLVFGMAGLVAACNKPPKEEDDSDSTHDSEVDGDAGDSGDGEMGSDTTAEGDADEITVTINIPEDFDATPEMLSAVFYESSAMQGMPDAMGGIVNGPEIVAGEPYEFVTTQAGLEGEYYMAVTLYCENGGGGQFPVPGVDWIGAASSPLTLGPGTGMVEGGEIEIMVLPGK